MSVSVEELLEKIDDMIDRAWNMPLSGGKCLIEADQLRDILDDIRANLPSEIRQAKAIVSDRTDIVATARKEAESIIRSAEDRQRSMISREEIVLQAQQKANEMLTKTQKRTKEMRKSAQDFTEELLKKTEDTLAQQLVEIRQARQAVRAPAQKLMYEESEAK